MGKALSSTLEQENEAFNGYASEDATIELNTSVMVQKEAEE